MFRTDHAKFYMIKPVNQNAAHYNRNMGMHKEHHVTIREVLMDTDEHALFPQNKHDGEFCCAVIMVFGSIAMTLTFSVKYLIFNINIKFNICILNLRC